MRTAYFILGMHRSGTSALASTLNSLGIPLGESLLDASEDNPKGYFENKAVQEFNETLLVSRGHGWDDVFFDVADINELDYQRLVNSAVRILEKEFSCFEAFAVKDPRVCLLLPIWLDACRKLDIQPKAVLAHRHPLEIAQSLKKRNGMDTNNAISLWADHMFKAEFYSRGIERILVSYDDLLNDFDKVATDFSEFTGGLTSESLAETSVIDKTLRHHKTRAKKLTGVPKCLEILLQQYEQGSLVEKALSSAMSEFNSLKGMFFNANRTAHFHQVFEERKKYKAEKDDFSNALQSTTAKLKNKSEELLKVKDDLEKLKSDRKSLTESVQQRDERIRNEVEKKNELSKELTLVRGTLQKKDLSEQRNLQQLDVLNTEILALEKSNKELVSQSASSADKSAQLQSTLNQKEAAIEKLELANQHLSQKLESLKKDVGLFSERNEELKAAIATRDDKIRAETDKKQALEKANAKLTHEFQKVEIDNKHQHQKVEVLQANLDETVSANKKLNKELTRVNSILNDITDKYEAQKLEIARLLVREEELKQVSATLKDITDKYETQKLEIARLLEREEELKQVNSKFKDVSDKYEAQKLEVARLKESEEDLKSVNQALISDIKKLDEDIVKHKGAESTLTNKVQMLEMRGIETSAQLEALQQQLKEANQAIEVLTSDLDNMNSSASQWIDLVVSPLATVASGYAKDKEKHSRLRASFKTAMLSGRLDNAVKQFMDGMETAKNIPLTFIANFDESGYFTCNEDVEVATESGEFKSGLDHFLKFGYLETMQGKRKLHPKGTLFNPDSVKDGNVERAFTEFLSLFYDDIKKRKALVKSKEKAVEKAKQENVTEVASVVAQTPVSTAAIQRRPAPNHISALQKIPTVDIILPVYNALEDVKACIESLYNNETIPFNLIIIDDCSEEETKSWLESAQKEYGFKLSRNTENLRFTKTVNKGFSQSEGDFVVLLNSDTIVTAYWLEKILCCFESDSSVGIVGPLSNAASWQTVPVREDKVNGGWLVNEIPEGYSIELMGQLVETISQRQYPNVPSVNGFCYVIKRDVINQIGTLDEEYFPTGYGEEDDFSIRARKAGYTIRVADDTYVFHAKSKSYTKEVRKVLTVGGRKSLDKKHGKEEIEKLIAAWKAEPLLPEIGKEIESFMQISSGNKKVVFTAIFGNYDNLKTPEYINPDWDYVCFTDNKNVESDVFTIKHVNQRFENVTKNARMIKLLSHLFLINYEYSLWIDGSVKLRGKNIDELVNHNLSANYISLHNHVKRDCVYEEADACMLAKKDGNDILARQIAEYRNEGLPESVGVFETAEIARRQWAPEVQMLNSLWWQQLDAFSIRDQVALPFVFWKHNFTSFVMEGNQWLDAYFHMYKHRASQSKHNTAVELLVHVESTDTDVTALIDNIFEKTNYTNFVVKVLLSNSVTLNDSGKRALQQRFGNSLAFVEETKHLSPSDLNGVVKGGKTELCCLLSEDIKLFNSDWLDVLVDGVANDENVTFVGPTILNEEFDFVASSVRVKRKQGELKEVFNARKVGGTGAVLAIHQSCILFNRQHFVRLGGFNSVFTTLRSAAIELFHRNTKDKKHTLLASNSEVIIKNDCEEVEMDLLARLLK